MHCGCRQSRRQEIFCAAPNACADTATFVSAFAVQLLEVAKCWSPRMTTVNARIVLDGWHGALRFVSDCLRLQQSVPDYAVAAQRDRRVDACGVTRFDLAAREPVVAQSALWSAQSQRRLQRRCETPSAQSTRRIFQKILCDLRALCVEIRLRGLGSLRALWSRERVESRKAAAHD